MTLYNYLRSLGGTQHLITLFNSVLRSGVTKNQIVDCLEEWKHQEKPNNTMKFLKSPRGLTRPVLAWAITRSDFVRRNLLTRLVKDEELNEKYKSFFDQDED